ncbi:component of the polarisome, partial [Clydaea vesicula]
MSESETFEQYASLRQYLASYLFQNKSSNSNQRANAREKLTKLSTQQFNELSTDVFDELNRRLADSRDLPFLAVRDDFHPKRNQARQKLATLPTSRFKDLASDVYYELERRFPLVIQNYSSKYGDNDGTMSAGTDMWQTSSERPPSATPNQQNSFNRSETPNRPGSRQNTLEQQSRIRQSSQKNVYQNDSYKISNPVNFESLDNLMADLGGDVPKNNNEEAILKLKKEYEAVIRDLQTKNKRLDDECNNSRNTVYELNGKISTLNNNLKELESNYQELNSEHKKLKEEYENLQDDYSNQQNIANDIRTEATNLLEEIKALSRRNDELMEENKNLKLQSDEKGGYSKDKPLYNEKNQEQYRDILNQETVASYQAAVGELLRAARSDTPTSVLVAMKSIVIACKDITEDTEAFEASPDNNLSYEDKDTLFNVKNSLSGALTSLMGAAKNHATSFGNSPISILENAATDLTSCIVQLVQLLNFKGDSRNLEGQFENGGYLGEGNGNNYNGSNREIFDLDQLKEFLEQQTELIVQAIQNLLSQMRQSTTFGQEFKDTVSGITSIVDHLVIIAHKTLSKPEGNAYRQKGEIILEDLSNANVTLQNLGVNMISSPQSKTLKQKLASSSYEIAK